MTVIPMIPNDTPFLPPKVTDVPKDILRNFPHSKKVGNYLLGNTLGEGSFAKVKEALHIPTGERVAVKIIDKKKTREDSYVRKNLRREGKILQMIRHAHIVQLLEIMETQNSYYLVTELCRGGDLMDYISQKRKLPEIEVKKYIRQIVSAVDYLHRLGILHRDLKIENLLLDEYKDMKIIDFGLSNCVKVVQTKDGPKVQEYCVTQCGSPAYAAPELLGRNKYGPQVDIWSIGVNMYAMLTGNLPFTVEPFNIKALHNKMITGEINPLPDGLSRDCRDILKKLLNPDPDRRITVEDILKHPWIAEAPGVPYTRAPCPNKLKTETLDNSILKHMSENQGFRVGEVIRYVTGNVPSSATAMYYLINRKLTKHYGNLRASGKIAAENRILHRTHINNDLVGSSQRSHAVHQVSRHLVNHTANSVKNAVNAQNHAQNHGIPNKTRQPEVDADENDTESHEKNAKDTEDEKTEPDQGFTDILQNRATNGLVQIPRVASPVKAKKDEIPDNPQVTHLPSVANKYVLGSRRPTADNVIPASVAIKTDRILNDDSEKRSAPESTDVSDEETFRPRASTFPGKIQRPVLTVNKLISDRNDEEQHEQPEGVVRTRIYKVKADNGNVVRDTRNKSPSSPISRRGSPYRELATSPGLRTVNSPYLVQYRKHSGIRRRIAQKVTLDIENSKDSLHEDDIMISTDKNILTRPSRVHRFSRVSTGSHTARDDRVVFEQLTEMSTARPISRNEHSNHYRSATPALPSLVLDSGKRNH